MHSRILTLSMGIIEKINNLLKKQEVDELNFKIETFKLLSSSNLLTNSN